MSELSNRIRGYVNDPSVGKLYGEWGILNRDQRKQIKKLCDLCDSFERAADYYATLNTNKGEDLMPKCPKCGGMLTLVISPQKGKTKVCKSCGERVPMPEIDEHNHQIDASKYTLARLKITDYNIPVLDNFWEHIKMAKIEATKRDIAANVVAINDSVVYSKLCEYPFEIPMICGLRCVYTEELPNEMLFAVMHSDNPPLTVLEQNRKLEAENKALREKLESIISLITEE